jgi:hypothetical protein
VDRDPQARPAGGAFAEEAEVTLADDLRRLVAAGAGVAEGLGQLEEAADAIVAQAGPIVEHMTAPATLERAVVAGVAAAASTLGQEALRATVAPRTRPTSSEGRRQVRCERHGVQPWLATIVCANCRRVFQVADEQADRFAPEVCPCRSQLLPRPEAERPQPYSARVCCTPCFVDACRVAGGRMS